MNLEMEINIPTVREYNNLNMPTVNSENNEVKEDSHTNESSIPKKFGGSNKTIDLRLPHEQRREMVYTSVTPNIRIQRKLKSAGQDNIPSQVILKMPNKSLKKSLKNENKFKKREFGSRSQSQIRIRKK